MEYNVHFMKALALREVTYRMLAERVDVNPATLRSYARGDSLPNVVIGLNIASELGVDPRWLWLEEPTRFELDEAPRLAETIRRATVKRTRSVE